MSIFSYWKRRREQQELEQQAQHEADMAESKKIHKINIAKVEESTRVMTAKPCPMIGHNCSVYCVHFQEGFAEKPRVITWDGGKGITADWKPSSCKLWGVK